MSSLYQPALPRRLLVTLQWKDMDTDDCGCTCCRGGGFTPTARIFDNAPAFRCRGGCGCVRSYVVYGGNSTLESQGLPLNTLATVSSKHSARQSGSYESPALPLSYSAAAVKLIERDPERQLRFIEHITVEQNITIPAPSTPAQSAAGDSSECPLGDAERGRRLVGHAVSNSATNAGPAGVGGPDRPASRQNSELRTPCRDRGCL